MIVQPLLGAIGGLIVYAIWASGVVEIAGLDAEGWASIASVAFVGGFSEPFLFSVVARISGAGDQKA